MYQIVFALKRVSFLSQIHQLSLLPFQVPSIFSRNYFVKNLTNPSLFSYFQIGNPIYGKPPKFYPPINYSNIL